MNCLPVGPHTLDTPEKMKRYFDDLRRWNFDVPYNAFYAHPMRLVLGQWKPIHIEFAKRAKDLGLPPCIQIQSTVALAEDVPVEGNAQYYHDDTPDVRETLSGQPVDFFASFASRAWRDFLKNLISIFSEYGYEWLVLEEPMLRTEIPGKKDPMYKLFCERYPARSYPLHLCDSEEYYLLQRLKRDVLVDFFAELLRHARAAGFKMIGCMPWFFTPTYENTPAETWNSCCDQARLALLEEMDFIVVRMQPDNLFAEVTIADDGEALPRQVYVETMAHHFGKPIVVVNNPTNEHLKIADQETLIPYEFFAPYTLAAAAASPNGMTRHWYGQDYGADLHQMELMTRVNEILPRLSTPLSPYAVVFSYAGVERILPRGWRQIWKHFFFLTRQMVFSQGIPIHTLFAESIKQQLQNCAEIKCIFLMPFFPIPPAEVEYLRKWVASAPDRWLVFIGAHNGVTWDISFRQSAPQLRPNEVVDLFGVDPRVQVKVMPFSDCLRLAFTGDSDKDSFWGEKCTIQCAGFSRFGFKADDLKDIKILYTTEDGAPVVFEKSYGEKCGKALLIGCGLDGVSEDFPLHGLLAYLNVKWELWNGETLPALPITSKAPNLILWNLSRTGYLVVANQDKIRGEFRINLPADKWQLWDVTKKNFFAPNRKFKIDGYSLRCFRLVQIENSLLDINGQIYLDTMTEAQASIEIRGYFNPQLTIISRKEIANIYQGGEELPFVQKKKKNHYETFISKIKETIPIMGKFS